MTAVGKILVFLNLVFAFVVGAFAVMDYTARTHWADGYDKLKKSYDVVKATNDTYKGEADRLVKERDSRNRELLSGGVKAGVLDDKQDPAKATEAVLTVLRAQKQENEQLRERLNLANKNLEQANRNVLAYDTTQKTGQVNVQRMQLDNDKLRAVLRSETDRNIDLTKGINEMRDRAVAAEIESKSFKNINGRLEQQLQDIARDLARLKATGGRPATGLASGTNPPPDEVEGLVSRVDGSYVKLTIGSDAGLARGHTMYVFGITGSGTGYRGQIRLETVSAHEAVGVVLGKAKMPIKVGDTVASSIMGGRK